MYQRGRAERPVKPASAAQKQTFIKFGECELEKGLTIRRGLEYMSESVDN